MQAVEDAAEPSGKAASDHLNTWVALTVALLATFLAICKVKDDNVCQAMQQAQADKIDHWAYYQARNLREEVAQAALDQLTLARATQPASAQAEYQATIERYQALMRDQADKKEEVRKQAEEDQRNYDELNKRDDQFDLSDALLAISISMLAVTALTHKRWMYVLAMFPTGFGVLMGLAGLFGWDIHPDRVISWLT